MSVKSMFICSTKQQNEYGTTLSFFATQGESGEESKQLNEATPGGSISLHIAPGKPAADEFEQGQAYYVTFDKVEVAANAE